MTRKPKPKDATLLALRLSDECTKHHLVLFKDRCGTTRGKTLAEIAADAEELVRLAKRARRYAGIQCNGIARRVPGTGVYHMTWNEADDAWLERARGRIEKRATALLTPYGAKLLTVSGDPRGYVMRFELASGARNGIGEGWGL